MERLTDYLRASGVDRLELRISEIESIVGSPLPESAKNWRAFWNNSEHNSFSQFWLMAGYRVTTRTASPGVVGFVRDRGHAYLSPGRPRTLLDPAASGMTRRERRPEPPSRDQYRDYQHTAGGLPQRRPPESRQRPPAELPQGRPPEPAHEREERATPPERRNETAADYFTGEPPAAPPELPPQQLAGPPGRSPAQLPDLRPPSLPPVPELRPDELNGPRQRATDADRDSLYNQLARSQKEYGESQATRLRDERGQHLADEADEPTPLDSAEMREVETSMIAELGRRLGMQLSPRSFVLPEGGRLVVDAASGDAQFLCEAWAYQGPPRAAQRHEVVAEAFKLHFLSQVLGGERRLALLFGDAQAAAPFRGSKWFAQALRLMGIEIHVVDLPEELRRRVITTQER